MENIGLTGRTRGDVMNAPNLTREIFGKVRVFLNSS